MSPVDALLEVLDLETLEETLFRGASLRFGARVFGGQVIAQSVVAAARTMPAERVVHSLNAYFLLPGDPGRPIVFQVERIRDGGSFATRRVTAVQGGRAIFILSASFQRGEDGYEHQVAMPDVPPPEALPDEETFAAMVAEKGSEAMKRYWARPRPLTLRPVDPGRYLGRRGAETHQAIWVKTSAPLPDDPALHRTVLAYLSDMTLLDTALAVHGRSVFDADLQVASLDHAMWFHRQPKVDDWVLYAQDSPSTSSGRGFTRGLLFARDGALLASVAQEGLMRVRRFRT
ncbi:MAG TPA: acyl-CoA thioesterase II [Methylomirabilota bacterium]|nr:acyl-CoA thioesterase II [Methylomirabilota bacterium]